MGLEESVNVVCNGEMNAGVLHYGRSSGFDLTALDFG